MLQLFVVAPIDTVLFVVSLCPICSCYCSLLPLWWNKRIYMQQTSKYMVAINCSNNRQNAPNFDFLQVPIDWWV